MCRLMYLLVHDMHFFLGILVKKKVESQDVRAGGEVWKERRLNRLEDLQGGWWAWEQRTWV